MAKDILMLYQMWQNHAETYHDMYSEAIAHEQLHVSELANNKEWWLIHHIAA